MTSPLVERLKHHVVSGVTLRPFSLLKPWVCADCQDTLRRFRRRNYTGVASSSASSTAYANDHETRDDRSVSRKRDTFVESLVTSLTARRISELTNPLNWAQVHHKYLLPFRNFLEARESSEQRAQLRSEGDDPYHVSYWLCKKDPAKLVTALLEAADDPEYLRSIPLASWTSILHAVSPRTFVHKLHGIHRSSKQKDGTRAGYNHEYEVNEYMRELSRIINLRRHHGIDASIVDYQILLSNVASVGNQKGAKNLWSDMKRDGIKPDQICYNRFMEAIVWDEEDRMRQARRARDSMPRTDYKTTNITLFKPGGSDEIIELYNEMTVNGVPKDVSTYCVVLTALARDGHFDDAVNILARVWKVDIHALMDGRDVPDMTTKESFDSPLFPTPRLLVTIADIYGTVNRLPAGFRVVDYISRQYNLTIKRHVWYQLLKWTFLQAGVKQNHRALTENGAQLNMRVVRSLLDTMQAEPYNVEMSMDIYHIAFQTFARSPSAFRDTFQPADGLKILDGARPEYMKALEKYHELHRRRSDRRQRHKWNSQLTEGSDLLRHAEDRAMIQKQRYRQYFHRWAKQILQLPDSRRAKLDYSHGPHNETLTSWRVRGIPNFLEKWGSFAPSHFEYSTDMGIISLVFRTAQEELKNKLQKAYGRRKTLGEKLVIRKRIALRKRGTKVRH